MKYVVFALLFASIGAGFALQNATSVTVSFAIWSFQTSLVLVILGSATVGALIILLLAAPVQIRLRWAAEKSMRNAAELETKLSALESKQPSAAISQANQAGKTQNASAEDAKAEGKGITTNGI